MSSNNTSNDKDSSELSNEQPFLSHLIELRDRLLRVIVVVLSLFVVLFYFANDLFRYLSEPLLKHLPESSTMIATGVASPFLTPFKLTLVTSIFIAMPYFFYQMWHFVAPGLYRHEKRLAMPLLFSTIVLFYAGLLFAYYVVFPLMFAFFTATTPEGVAMMTDISQYLDFVLKMFFAFGMAFEVPIATIMLVVVGMTSAKALVEKRPYVIVGSFFVGMLLTPPDVISQILLAVPIWLLFELGVIIARMVDKSEDAEEEEEAEPRYRPMTQEEMDAELDAIEKSEKDH